MKKRDVRVVLLLILALSLLADSYAGSDFPSNNESQPILHFDSSKADYFALNLSEVFRNVSNSTLTYEISISTPMLNYSLTKNDSDFALLLNESGIYQVSVYGFEVMPNQTAMNLVNKNQSTIGNYSRHSETSLNNITTSNETVKPNAASIIKKEKEGFYLSQETMSSLGRAYAMHFTVTAHDRGSAIATDKSEYTLGEMVVISLGMVQENDTVRIVHGFEEYLFLGNAESLIEFIPPSIGLYRVVYQSGEWNATASFKILPYQEQTENIIMLQKNSFFAGEHVRISLAYNAAIHDSNASLYIQAEDAIYHLIGNFSQELIFVPPSPGLYEVKIELGNKVVDSGQFEVLGAQLNNTALIHIEEKEYFIADSITLTPLTLLDSVLLVIEGSAREFYNVSDAMTVIPQIPGSYEIIGKKGNVIEYHNLSIQFREENQNVFNLDEPVNLHVSLKERADPFRSLLNILFGTSPLNEISFYIKDHQEDARFNLSVEQLSREYFSVMILPNPDISESAYTLVASARVDDRIVNTTTTFFWKKQDYQPEPEEGQDDQLGPFMGLMDGKFTLDEQPAFIFDFTPILPTHRNAIELAMKKMKAESFTAYVVGHEENAAFNLSVEHLEFDTFNVSIQTNPEIKPDMYLIEALATFRNISVKRQYAFYWGPLVKEIFIERYNLFVQQQIDNNDSAVGALITINDSTSDSYATKNNGTAVNDSFADFLFDNTVASVDASVSQIDPQRILGLEGFEPMDEQNKTVFEFIESIIIDKNNKSINADIIFYRDNKVVRRISNIPALTRFSIRSLDPSVKLNIWSSAGRGQGYITLKQDGVLTTYSLRQQAAEGSAALYEIKKTTATLENGTIHYSESLHENVLGYNSGTKFFLPQFSLEIPIKSFGTGNVDVIFDDESQFNATPINLEEGVYDVVLDPLEGPIEQIEFSNLEFNGSFDVGIDTVPLDIGSVPERFWMKVYAIDPTKVSFATATVTSIAQGSELYKCQDWIFEARQCAGSWAKIMDLEPGKLYTHTLTAQDPGYAESGVASVNTNKSLYHPNEHVKLTMVVLDIRGHLVSGAAVTLDVTDPANLSTRFATSANSITEVQAGIYEAEFRSTTLEGNYSLFVNATAQDSNNSMRSYFTVKSFYEFDILRDTPVTIDPFKGPFVSALHIVSLGATEEFDVTEVLPINFSILQATGATIISSGNKTFLQWDNVNNDSEVSYVANSPLITPDLWELGPAFITYPGGQFVEARPWYLAVDPIVIETADQDFYEQNNTDAATIRDSGGFTETQAQDCQAGTCISTNSWLTGLYNFADAEPYYCSWNATVNYTIAGFSGSQINNITIRWSGCWSGISATGTSHCANEGNPEFDTGAGNDGNFDMYIFDGTTYQLLTCINTMNAECRGDNSVDLGDSTTAPAWGQADGYNNFTFRRTSGFTDGFTTSNQISIKFHTYSNTGCGSTNTLDDIIMAIDYANLTVDYYSTAGDAENPRMNVSLNNSIAGIYDVVNITANVSDNQGLHTCRFFMNGTANGAFVIHNKTVIGTNDQCSQNFTISLARGSAINFTVIVNDTSTAVAGGNINRSQQIFTVQNKLPIKPVILFPNNNDNLPYSTVPINVTFAADQDSDPLTIYYYLDGIFNTSTSQNITLNLTDGTHIINVSVYDGFGSSTNATVTFTVDSDIPRIVGSMPAMYENVHRPIVTFNYSVYDRSDLSMDCNLTVNGRILQSNIVSPVNISNFRNVTGLGTGIKQWNVTCWDNDANINTSNTYNFTYDRVDTVVSVETNQSSYGQGNNVTLIGSLASKSTDQESGFRHLLVPSIQVGNGSTTSGDATITLPRPMLDSNYAVIITASDEDDTQIGMYGARTTTSFNVRLEDDAGNAEAGSFHWLIVPFGEHNLSGFKIKAGNGSTTASNPVTIAFETAMDDTNYTVLSTAEDEDATQVMMYGSKASGSFAARMENDNNQAEAGDFTWVVLSYGEYRYNGFSFKSNNSNTNTFNPVTVNFVTPFIDANISVLSTAENQADEQIMMYANRSVWNVSLRMEDDGSATEAGDFDWAAFPFGADFTPATQTSFVNYTFFNTQNYTKVSDVNIIIEVSYYNASGSVRVSNNYPDLEIQVFNGSDFIHSEVCDLDDTYDKAGRFYYNCSRSILNNTVLERWNNSLNRKIRIRGIDFDGNDTINYTSVFAEISSASKIENFGLLNKSGFLEMQVQKNISNIWQTIAVVYNQSINISANYTSNLSVYWTGWKPGASDGGQMRALISLYDLNYSLFQNYNGINVSDSYQFLVFDTGAPDLMLHYPSNVTVSGRDVMFNFSAIDSTDLSMVCNLTVNYKALKTGIDAPNGSYVLINISGLREGMNYWNVSCIDDGDNVRNSETANFTFDKIQGILSILTNQSLYTQGQNVTLIDSRTNTTEDAERASVKVLAPMIQSGNGTTNAAGDAQVILPLPMPNNQYAVIATSQDSANTHVAMHSSKNESAFSIRIEDDVSAGTAQTFDWLVVPFGEYDLNGFKIKAGNSSTSANNPQTITFVSAMDSVNYTIISTAADEDDTQIAMYLSRGVSSFQIQMEDDGNNAEVGSFDWVVIENGETIIDGVYVKANSSTTSAANPVTITFTNSMQNTNYSTLVTALNQNRNGIAMWTSKAAASFNVKLEDDQGNDQAGEFNYLAITASANVTLGGSSQYANYSFANSSNFSKVSDVRIIVEVAYYNATGSDSKQNSRPDIEIEFYNGSAFEHKATCDLEFFYGKGSRALYNCSARATNASVIVPWNLSYNRIIRMRGINMDYNDTINWTSIYAQISRPSKIENVGLFNRSGRLVLEVQSNSTSIWKTIAVVYNQSLNVSSNQSINLSNFWSGWKSDSSQAGLHRAYASFFDNNYSLIQNADGMYINDSYLFYVLDIQIPNVTLIRPDDFVNTINTTFYFNVSDSSPIINCTLILNTRKNVTNSSITVNQVNQLTVNNMQERFYNWSVNCTDTDGNVGNSTSVKNVTVDYTKPWFNLTYPYQNQTIRVNFTQFNFTVRDNLDKNLSCNLTLNNVVNVTDINASNGTITNFTIVGMPENLTLWYVQCRDDANNTNASAILNFTINLGTPQFFPFSPQIAVNNSLPTTGTVVNISTNATDESMLKIVIFSWNDTGTWVNYTNSSSTVASVNYSVSVTITAALGKVVAFMFYAIDHANNINATSVQTFGIQNSPPFAPTILFPRDGGFFNHDPIPLNITWQADLDNDPITAFFYINNTRNSTAPQNSTLNATDGYYSLNVSLFDTKVYSANATIFFSIDRINPVVNATLNKTTNVRFGDVINITANATDENQLSFGQIIVNDTGIFRYFNFSLNSLAAGTFSQNITISCVANCVINFTALVNDSAGNFRMNSTKITVSNAPPPLPIIVFPASNMETNRQPMPMNVTFAADPEGQPVTIYYYINGILNQTSLTNTTLNASDGQYVLNVSLTDGIEFSSNASVNFTIDTRAPIANRSFNKSGIYRFGDVINVSANATDERELSFGQVVVNDTGVKRYFNFSLDGSTTASFSYAHTIACGPECALNISIVVNDTAGNYRTNDTVILISNTLPFTPAILFPTPNLKTNQQPLAMNITYQEEIDGDPITIFYYINGVKNQTTSGNTTLNASDGQYILNVSLFDSIESSDNATVNFTIDLTVPIINYTFNKSLTSITFGDAINISANISDNFGLSFAQIIVNDTGFNRFFNFSLDDLNLAQASQNITISCSVGCVINFSIRVNDTATNVRTNTTLVEIGNTPPFNPMILFPRNNSKLNIQPLDINVTFQKDVDNDPTTIFYYINGRLNQTSFTNITFNASDGIYLLNVSISDGKNVSRNISINFSLDTIKPIVNSSLNKTTPLRIGDVINVSGNATDDVELSFGQVVVNDTGAKRYFNFSLDGQTQGSFSQSIAITCAYTCVINFTVITNDSHSNVRMNDTIRSVENTPPNNPTILLPLNGSFLNSQPVWLNVTFAADADGHASTIFYYINGLFNQSSLSNVTFNASDGFYKLNVSLSDGFNFSQNVTINFTLDRVAPNITLFGPLNNSKLFTQNVVFFFNVTDVLDFNPLCNLTINDQVNQSHFEAINGTNTSVTVTNFDVGQYNWSVTCQDNASNTAFSGYFLFNVTPPDLEVSSIDIFFNTSIFEEQANITVFANITNIGTASASSILVRFYEVIVGGSISQIDVDRTISTLAPSQNTTVNVTFRFSIGLHEIQVAIDPLGSIGEQNETNNNASVNITIPLNHFITGNITGALKIQNFANRTIYSWDTSQASSGTILVIDSDSSITWTNLTALGRNITGGNASNDWAELDSAINATNLTDSVNRSYTFNEVPIALSSYILFSRTVSNVSITNSTNSTSFVTGILWDMSDDRPGSGNGQYNGSEDLIFVSQTNRTQLGKYGYYDFEVRVPSRLRQYKGPDMNQLTFYVELI